MAYRTAKAVLLVALVALGLSPLATKAQQREPKSDAANRKESVKQPAAKQSARPKAAAGDKGSSQDRLSVTPEREAAVMTFVNRNHAELAQLLDHLKANQPKEYDRAIRELFRTTERLTQIHDRDRTQYDLELRLWKTQSRIQLLTAQLQMGDTEDLRRELQVLLGEQIDNRSALLRHDRQKAAARLERIDDDLKRLETDRQKMIDRQLQSLTRSMKARRTSDDKKGRDTKASAGSSESKRTPKTAE